MNLYLYDDKHEQVLAEMPIENEKQTQAIIDFLEANHVTDRYKSLIIANSYEIICDDGERLISFVDPDFDNEE